MTISDMEKNLSVTNLNEIRKGLNIQIHMTLQHIRVMKGNKIIHQIKISASLGYAKQRTEAENRTTGGGLSYLSSHKQTSSNSVIVNANTYKPSQHTRLH